jgi:hypothetical protein
MTQAERVLSTPPINMPATRRRFLSNVAGIAAGNQREGVVNFDQQAAGRCATIPHHRTVFDNYR